VHKAQRKGNIAEFVSQLTAASLHQAEKTWHIPCDIAPPSATQNELDLVDAEVLINSGVILVAIGANLQCTTDAIDLFRKARISFEPAKAANAGGVDVSRLKKSKTAVANLGMNPNYTNYYIA
jgi:glutamate dehydrogenase (NADP+)